MAGAANNERLVSAVVEATAGTTPTTPAFKRQSFSTFNMTANPRTTENRSVGARGQRTGVALNGFAVSGTASSGLIYGEFDDFLASLFQADWASNVLKNGAGSKTFTIEDSIPQGQGGALSYLRYRGVEASGGSLSLTAGDNANLSFDLIGTGSDNATPTAISNATYTASTAFDVIGSGSDIGTITMSGLGTLDCMQSAEVQFTYDGKDEQLRIASDDICGVSRGSMLPTVTGAFYIEDNFMAIYNACRAGTEFALTIPIGSTTLKKYDLFFPRCKFSEAPLVTGESGPALQNVTVLPMYDTTEACTVRMRRNLT